MKISFRNVLIDSNVAPIAIAFSLAGSVYEGIYGITPVIVYYIYSAVAFLLTAATEGEMPLVYSGLNGFDIKMLFMSLPHLVTAAAYGIAAWVLSLWIYGKGPLRSLRITWSERPRRSNV